MMQRFLMASVALVAAATGASAGGYDRFTQGVAFMFEPGSYAELSFGYVSPSVEANPAPTGDIAVDFATIGLAYKRDLSDKLSLGIQFDQPFGANVQYPAAFPFMGAFAELKSSSVNAIGRYKFDGGVSVLAGLRYVTIDGSLYVPRSDVAPQSFSADSELGFLVGMAYERPDIALRVALTYFSETEHALDSSVGTVGTINPPQAVNLDFQTGIAADTLLFGQIRWADWTHSQVNVPPAALPGTPVITHKSDSVTYTLGIGRRFNEQWSGALTLGYEEGDGGPDSLLSPTDGFATVGLAVTYTMDKVKVTGVVRYVELGDASTLIGPFTGNSAVAAGVRIGWTF